jgi:hypothetical protein
MGLTEQLIAIISVFALLGGSVYILGRRNGSFQFLTPLRRPNAPKALRCTGRLPLTAQHAIHIVEIEGRSIIVATFPGGVAFEPQPAAFSALLGHAMVSGEPKQ